MQKVFLKVIVPLLRSRKRFDHTGVLEDMILYIYIVDPCVKNCDEKKKRKRRGRERRKMMKDRTSCNMHEESTTLAKARFIVNLRIPITIHVIGVARRRIFSHQDRRNIVELETFFKIDRRWNWFFEKLCREFCVEELYLVYFVFG